MSEIKLLRKKSLIKKNKNRSKKSKYSRVNHVQQHYASGWFNSECLSLNNNNNNFVQNYDHNLISEALQKQQQQYKQLFSSRSVVENGSKKLKRKRNCKSSASSTNHNNNNANDYDWSIEELIPAHGSGDNQNLSKYNECATTITNNSNNKINCNKISYHRESKIILESHTGRRNQDTNKQMINSENFMINKNHKTEQLKNDSIMTSTVFYNQLETVAGQYREPKNSKDLREHRQRTGIESPVTNLDSLISSSNRKLCGVHQTEEPTSNTCSSFVKHQGHSQITNENISKDNNNNKQDYKSDGTNSKIKVNDPTISNENIPYCIPERNLIERMSTKVLDWKTVVLPPPSSSILNETTNKNRAVTYCRHKITNENDYDDEKEEESFGSDGDEEEPQESDNPTIINPLNNLPFFDNKQFGDCENNNEFCEIKKFNNTCKTFFEKCVNSSKLNTTIIVSRDNERENDPSINVSEDGDQNTTAISSLKIFPEWIQNPDGIDISYSPELKLDCLLVDKPRLNSVNENLERIPQQTPKLEILSKKKLSSSSLLVNGTFMELESNAIVDDECCPEQSEKNSNSAKTKDLADHLEIEPLLLIDPVFQDKNLENDHTNSLYENIEIDRNNAFQLELENLRKDSFKYGDKVHLLSENENEHCATAICEIPYDSCSCNFQEENSNDIIISNNNDDDNGLIQGDTDDESIEKLFVSPRLHDAPSSTTIILSTNYLSSTNILNSVHYEPLIDEEILDDESECLLIQAITGTTINDHAINHRMKNIDDQQQETEKPNSSSSSRSSSIHNETFNYKATNFETINHVSNNDDNNNITIKVSATNLTPEHEQHETILYNVSQRSDEDNISQPQKNENHEKSSRIQIKDSSDNESLCKSSTLALDEESNQLFFNLNQSPRLELEENENGIIQTQLYDHETAFLWESEINANESSSSSSSSSSSNDTYVVELKSQSTDLISLFAGPDNEIKTPLPVSEKTIDIVQSSTQTFEKSSTLFHRKDKKKKRVSTTKNVCDTKTCCINNSKSSKHKVISRQNNNNSCTSKKLKNTTLIQSRNAISSSLLVPNLKNNDGIGKSKEVNNNNSSFRRLQNSKIPISTKKYLENHCRKMGKEKRKGLGYRQSSSLLLLSAMEKHNNILANSNNTTIKNSTTKKSAEGSIKLSSPLDFFETIQEPSLKLISVKENCSANIKHQDYPKFQCITKIELDPFVVVRIPSFEIVSQSSHHVHYTSTFKESQPVIKINSHSNENDHFFDNYSVPNLLPSSTFNTSQDSLKIMKEAENFLTEYRRPGSLSFVEKLPQFAAFYDLLRESTSNGEHRSSLIVQSDSSSTSKISKKSQSKHKEKMIPTFTRKRKFSLRKCISRRFRSIFRCCYTKRRRKDSHCCKMYSHSAN